MNYVAINFINSESFYYLLFVIILEALYKKDIRIQIVQFACLLLV